MHKIRLTFVCKYAGEGWPAWPTCPIKKRNCLRAVSSFLKLTARRVIISSRTEDVSEANRRATGASRDFVPSFWFVVVLYIYLFSLSLSPLSAQMASPFFFSFYFSIISHSRTLKSKRERYILCPVSFFLGGGTRRFVSPARGQHRKSSVFV